MIWLRSRIILIYIITCAPVYFVDHRAVLGKEFSVRVKILAEFEDSNESKFYSMLNRYNPSINTDGPPTKISKTDVLVILLDSWSAAPSVLDHKYFGSLAAEVPREESDAYSKMLSIELADGRKITVILYSLRHTGPRTIECFAHDVSTKIDGTYGTLLAANCGTL